MSKWMSLVTTIAGAGLFSQRKKYRAKGLCGSSPFRVRAECLTKLRLYHKNNTTQHQNSVSPK